MHNVTVSLSLRLLEDPIMCHRFLVLNRTICITAKYAISHPF